MMLDDLTQIVRQAQAEELNAWSALVKQFQRPAQRVAFTILGNQDDVEDALQDAWLYRGWP